MKIIVICTVSLMLYNIFLTLVCAWLCGNELHNETLYFTI